MVLRSEAGRGCEGEQPLYKKRAKRGWTTTLKSGGGAGPRAVFSNVGEVYLRAFGEVRNHPGVGTLRAYQDRRPRLKGLVEG